MKYVRNFDSNSKRVGANTIEIDQFLNINLGIFQTMMIIGYMHTYKINGGKRFLPSMSHKTEIMAAKKINLKYFI